MTREEAIEKLKGFDLIGSNEDIEFQEVLDMAIKSIDMAIKSIDMCDKVKAEIDKEFTEVTDDIEHGRKRGLYRAVYIIEKYKK